MVNKKRPKHNFNAQVKNTTLAVYGINKYSKATSRQGLGTKKSIPSKRTVRRWQQQAREGNLELSPIHKGGIPPKLSEAESLVLGGWILERNKQYKRVAGKDIIEWVKKSFNELISKTMVSTITSKLHITTHYAKVKERKYLRPSLVSDMFNFMLTFRKDHPNLSPSRIVAIDVCKFSIYGRLLRSYSPEGKKN